MRRESYKPSGRKAPGAKDNDMNSQEWSDGSHHPTVPGWYAVQMCWDVSEGIHVFAVEIPGTEWDRWKARNPPWHGPHLTKDEALDWGYDNDPEGL